MTKKKYLRRITVYKDYFKDFKRTLPVRTIQKIYQVFLFIMTLETPQNEIEKAKRLMKEYFENKNKIQNGRND